MRKTFTDRGPRVPQSTEKSGHLGNSEEQAQGFQKIDNMPANSMGQDWPEWDEANEETHRPFGHGGFLPRRSYRER